MQKRIKTKYPGVTYRLESKDGRADADKVYYIRYRLGGRGSKEIEEPIYPAKGQVVSAKMAADIRADRMRGKEPTNALKRAALMEASVENQGGRVTFDFLWREYKHQRPDLKGLATDESRFNKYLAGFASMTPDEIRTGDVDSLKRRLTKDGKSPQTIKNVLELLRRLVNFGVRKGWCAQPEPSRLVFEFPKVNNIKTEDLCQSEVERLMQALDEEPNQKAANLMRLALYTGMRRGELFRLKWEDIDWERGFISLTGDQSNGYDAGPKGGKNKKIPLTEPAAEVLLQVKEAAGDDIGPYVFPGRDGKGQLTDIRRQVRRIKEKAGLPEDFRPLHGLRHTFASSLASSGEVDMYTLQKLMTHTSPQMTERYAHLRDEALQKAGQVVGKLFKRRSSNLAD